MGASEGTAEKNGGVLPAFLPDVPGWRFQNQKRKDHNGATNDGADFCQVSVVSGKNPGSALTGPVTDELFPQNGGQESES